MNVFQKALRGLRSGIITLVIEAPAHRTGMDRLINRLEKSGQAVEKRAAAARGRPVDAEALAHIIGIERWAQRRLKVALGEPLAADEYDMYRPETKDWAALQTIFHTTRLETLSLSKSLRMAGVDPATQVQHNQFGEVSLLGWLYYINLHANIESRKLG